MISPGVILIRNDRGLPETLTDGTSRFSPHWVFLAHHAGRPELDDRLAAAGWTSSYPSSSIRRAATGLDKQAMIKAALARVLAGAGLRESNCIEIGEIRMHSFLAIPYASVSGHACQLRLRISPPMGEVPVEGDR